MNSLDGDCFVPNPGTTTPAKVPPGSTESPGHGPSEKLMMNSTQNGYSTVPNHVSMKSKSDSHSHKKKSDSIKHHDGSKGHEFHKSNDSSRHESDHSKRKDGDNSKHKDKSHSSGSHSKSKDISLSKDGLSKSHSTKLSDSSKPKEHSQEKEKKHHSSSALKAKESSLKHSDHMKHSSDHSKHVANVKKESEGTKHIDKQKSPVEKTKINNFKGSEKLKEGKIKEKLKDGKNKEHKEHKEKDKLKEKDKHKEIKVKDSKDKSKIENNQDKINGKPKDKIKDKHKHLSHDKNSDFKVISDSNKIEDFEQKEKRPLVVKIKDPVNSISVKEEPMSDDDVPLSERKPTKELKVKAVKREKEESDDEPLASRAQKVKKTKSESIGHKRKLIDDDEDYDYKKPVKKVKKEKENKKIKHETDASPKKRGKQKEEPDDVWKWWEEEKHEGGAKWRTLSHNGPVFAPPYEPLPKNIKFYYNGKHLLLSEETEEVAGFYARMLDHEYTVKDCFNKNFFKDWRKVMTTQEKGIITDISKCNFKELHQYYQLKSEERKNMSKEEKLEIKKQNEELQNKYGYCIIDGHKQKIGNFKIEPPGLFRGRGEHPKMGMLKRRVQPEDILINIGKESPVPKPPEGHKWKEVRHDNTVTWLASWNENILNSTKYIMLNPSSKLKGEKDWQKYETARKLKNHAERIRREYREDWKSKEMKVRQRAVALYFIDKLALRAGNEKDEDTADTVGCCSLRVEHITLDEEKDGQEYVVTFDFLGKDSIRYCNTVSVEKRVFKNLNLFMENKQPGDDLFDRLNTGILNKYLNELMEGLTAKVFRTYNASKTLQEQLQNLTKEEMSIPEKILAYNRANRAVAVLCNHQRSVPKGFSKSMETLKKKMDDKLDQIKECKKDFKEVKQMYKSSNASKDKVLVDKKKKRLQQLEDQYKKLEVQATDKEENKQIALGTSKLNYLDPRISVAWCKKWEVPIEKIYNRTQRDKFRWAIEMAGPGFQF